MAWCWLTGLGAGGTFTAIAFPFPPLPFFQQKGSPKRRSVWWNCPAQQTANLRAYKAGEVELKGCPELREKDWWEPVGSWCPGTETVCSQHEVTMVLGMLEPANDGGEAGCITKPQSFVGGICVWTYKVDTFGPDRIACLAFPVVWCYMRGKEQVWTSLSPVKALRW